MPCACRWLQHNAESAYTRRVHLVLLFDALHSVVEDERDDGLSPLASACYVDLSVRWTTEVASSVYATPLVTESLYGDGTSQVVVPAFVHALEALEVRKCPAALLFLGVSHVTCFTGSGRRPGGGLPCVAHHPGAREPLHV